MYKIRPSYGGAGGFVLYMSLLSGWREEGCEKEEEKTMENVKGKGKKEVRKWDLHK